MGYTSYWRRKKKLPARRFAQAAEDCRRVVEHLVRERGFLLTDDSEEGGIPPPLFCKDEVRFNGVGEEGHETFIVLREYVPQDWQKPERGLYFDFCKTARKPYDLAVCACLIAFARHFGESFPVGSDGDDDEENWPAARTACQAVLGYGGDFRLPAPDDFGRFVSGGIPYEKSPYASERNRYLLGNGWTMERRERSYRYAAAGNGYGWPRERVRVPRVVVYGDLYARPDSPVVCEAETLAEARHKATVEFLRRKFAGATDLDEFVGAFATTGDWTALAVWADRLDETTPEFGEKLRRLLPKGAPGAART
jgi:hypothetical protein